MISQMLAFLCSHLFHKVKWTAVSANEIKLHEGFLYEKALLTMEQNFVMKSFL